MCNYVLCTLNNILHWLVLGGIGLSTYVIQKYYVEFELVEVGTAHK